MNRQQSIACTAGRSLLLAATVAVAWASPSRADPIGVFAFLPPFSTSLPTGGAASLDTKGITLSGEGETQLRIGGRLQEDFGAAA